MNLKDFLANRDTKEKDFFWALVMESGWLQAGIWNIEETKAHVVSVSPPIAWETDEDLIGAVDAALSATVQSLPDDFREPSKTVFGVPASWVDAGQIKDKHLNKIKDICRELELEPSGFVVLPEAIAHFVKSEEGAPLSAVVVEIGKDYLEVAVFKMGKLFGTTQVSRSVSVIDDLGEGLSRFSGVDNLPSRIIVYNGKEGELDEVKQTINENDWEKSEKINFLHTPTVEVFSPEKKVLAVALAGGLEIGGVAAVDSGRGGEENTDEKGDIENIAVPKEGPAARDLGFVVGEDIARQRNIEDKEELLTKPEREVPQEVSSRQVSSTRKIIGEIKRKILVLFSKRSGKVDLGGKDSSKVFVWGLGFLAVLLISFFIYWWFNTKATVRIYVSPKKFEEKVEITIDPSVSILDLSKKTVPAKILKTEVTGEKIKASTGTKKVGDKTRGSVKIQNGTSSNINLKAGTVLVAANDLKFTLDSSASVSAALSPSLPGTQTLEVSAYDIGAEYNLAKDEIFKVANYPKADVDAVATSNFSGGSSRDITAVSSDDQKSLEDDLNKELVDNAKKDLMKDLSQDEFFVDTSLVAMPLSKTFSGKVGDEADNVKLTLNLEVKGYSIAKENLLELSRKVLEESVPSGYVLRADQLAFAFERSGDDKQENLFSVRVIANFLPEVNSDVLIRQIVGRDPNTVEKYLSTITGFKEAEIKIKPNFPGRLGTLPRISKNITLEILGEK